MDKKKSGKMISKFSKINRKLLPVKLHYFIFELAIGCGLPYRTLLAKQLGLSGSTVGIIFVAAPFAKIIANPLLGVLVDRYKRFRTTIALLLLSVALFHVFMTLLPAKVAKDKESNSSIEIDFTCSHLNSKIAINSTNLPLAADVSCKFQCTVCNKKCQESDIKSDAIISLYATFIPKNLSGEIELSEIQDSNTTIFNGSTVNSVNQDTVFSHCYSPLNCTSNECWIQYYGKNLNSSSTINEFSTVQFWMLLLFITLSSTAMTAVLFLMDTVCYEILESEPHKYGQQKLWSPVGWGLGTLLGGYINDLVTGNNPIRDYTAGFYLLAILVIVNIIPVMFVKVKNLKYSKNIFKDVEYVLRNRYVQTYIVMVYFVGVLSGLIWNYQMWFLEEIGASSMLMGLSMTAECFLSEIPCFLISGWVINKIGHSHCTSLTLFCMGLRFLSFVFMKDPWLSIPVALLHGPTYGIFYAALTSFGKTHALNGTEATVQSILVLVFEGAGCATGILLGGISFEKVGSRNTFQYAAITSLLLLIINIVLSLFKNQLNKNRETAEDPTNESGHRCNVSNAVNLSECT